MIKQNSLEVVSLVLQQIFLSSGKGKIETPKKGKAEQLANQMVCGLHESIYEISCNRISYAS